VSVTVVTFCCFLYGCRKRNKQRGCCPSCDKKRSLFLAFRLNEEVLAYVPHRQWVFTIPKRLRVYFRFGRSLLPGKLCRAAYDTICEVYRSEVVGDCGVPAMIGSVQTFGDLIELVLSAMPEGMRPKLLLL